MKRLLLILLLSGCLAPETPQQSPCLALPLILDNITADTSYDRIECIGDHSENCGGLTGASEAACKAIAARDVARCEAIGSQMLEHRCKMKVRENIGYTPRTSECQNLPPQQMVWCIIWEAKADGDCLAIDETAYPDESRFCYARVRGEPNLCEAINDGIIEDLCLRSCRQPIST